MKTRKRLLALNMAILLMLTLFPIQASAAEGDTLPLGQTVTGEGKYVVYDDSGENTGGADVGNFTPDSEGLYWFNWKAATSTSINAIPTTGTNLTLYRGEQEVYSTSVFDGNVAPFSDPDSRETIDGMDFWTWNTFATLRNTTETVRAQIRMGLWPFQDRYKDTLFPYEVTIWKVNDEDTISASDDNIFMIPDKSEQDDKISILSYEPDASGWYTVSQSYLLQPTEDIAVNDYIDNGCYLESGKTYYFIYNHSRYNDSDSQITMSKMADFPTLSIDQPLSSDKMIPSGNGMYYFSSFTPDDTGTYEFDGSLHDLWLGDDQGHRLAYNSDKLSAELEAGKTYILACYGASTGFTLSVSNTQDDSTVDIPETASVKVGESITLTPIITPDSSDSECVWTSSDETIAKVESGVVTGVKAGTATITVTLPNDNSDTCTVTVSSASKPVVPSGPSGGTSTPEPVKPVITENPDGSTTATETAKDGTVTATTTWEDGKQAVAVTSPKGEKTIAVTTATGEKIADVNLPTAPSAGKEFEDVADDAWYAEVINNATGYGLFNGTSETTFSPNDGMTRAMMATVLHNLSGTPAYGTGTSVFTDVEREKWYSDPIDWAYKSGVTAGTSETTFSPDDQITREQLVTMLHRYAEKIGASSSKRKTITDFPDGNKVADWAQDAMQWAVAEGLIFGKAEDGKNYIDPQGTATRAEVAAVFTRFVEYLKK